jgi:hypothetical protein
MKNIMRISVALTLIIGAGLVHGAWTSRWRPAPALIEMASRLRDLPPELNDWTATPSDVSSREAVMTGAVGNVRRIYRSHRKGQDISVLLLTGLPGDISTHTPEACYPGAGFALGTPETVVCRYGSPPRLAEFRTAVAKKGGTDPSVLRIFWGWRGMKGWSAPAEPRWAFGTEAVLTKLYVVRQTPSDSGNPNDDPGIEFLSELLPQLDSLVLSPGPESKVSGPVASTASR